MRRVRILLVVVVLALLAWGLWGAFRKGPAARISLTPDLSAVGRATTIQARFEEPKLGLAGIRVEAVQGDRVELLESTTFDALSAFSPLAKPGTTEATLEIIVGKESLPWLEEGELTIRASAEGPSGPLTSSQTIEELTLPVILRPPQLQVLSAQHYLRQGGAGAIAFLTDEGALRSGVRAGDAEFLSYAARADSPLERVCLFGIPFDVDRAADVRVFAEDAAGNRSEASFVDIFKPSPPTRDVINLSDGFLEKVVPAIVSQTPELDAEGSLIELYLAINGDLRGQNRALIRGLAASSANRRLWGGGFLPLPNARRMARYADTRSYRYEGREVDVQTHLGLDLASVRRAQVPAAAEGVVMHQGYVGIYGNSVVIDHGLGLSTLYAHLSSIEVETGQSVKRGDTIGRTGATGLAGGDHLHFGVFVQGVAVDPIEWLDAKWIRERIDPKIPAPVRGEGG